MSTLRALPIHGSILALVLVTLGCARTDATVTYRVEREPFVHSVEAEGQLRAAKTVSVMVPREVKRSVRVAWLAPDGSQVETGDVIARFDATEFREQLENGESDLQANSLRISKTDSQSDSKLSSIDKDFEVATLELEVAEEYQLVDAEVYSRSEILESSIDSELAGDKQGHASRMKGIQRDLAAAESALLEVEKRKVSINVQRARDGLDALEVRAPHSGLFMINRDWQGDPLRIGAQVWPGRPLAEIPEPGTMIAEVFVLESDAGGLEVGKKARLRVSAHPDVEFAALIDRVDPVAKPKERGSPVQYFGVTLTLESSDPELMKPGQRVDATLVLEQLDDALVVPRQSVFVKDGRPHVWVREGGAFTERAVELGRQSTGRSVILAGLDEGEVIALEPPGGGRSTMPEQTAQSAPFGSTGS